MNQIISRSVIPSLSSIFLCSFVFSAEVPEYQGAEVVVSATREVQPINKALSDISIISSEQIEKSVGEDLPSLLSRQSALQVFTSGGKGEVSSLFIRGMASQYSVILIDGMRIVSATNGTTALSQIPLSQIDHIEILRGPASSLYGADAVGGVIQIFTKQGVGKMLVSGSLSFGGRGTFTGNFALRGKNQTTKTAYSLNISQEQTDGFSATNQYSANYNPDNDGYRNTAYSASLSQDLGLGHTLSLNLYQSFNRNDYDQSLFNQDREKNRMSGQAITLKDSFQPNWDSILRYAHTQDDERFLELPSEVLQSFFTTTQDEFFWQNDIKTNFGKYLLGAVYTNQRINSSTQYERNSRSDAALFAGYQNQIGKHLLEASLRYDNDNQFGGATTGKIAYGYQFTDNLSARLSYGTAFKAPTFNDLYYPLYGNPNLKPEKSQSIELGLKAYTLGGRFEFSAFHNLLNNLIVYQDTSSSNSDVVVNGVSFSAASSWHDVDLSVSATYQNPYDKIANRLLVHRARAFAVFSASHDWDNLQAGLEWQLTGHSYDYPYALPTQRLAGYGVLNLFADYEFRADWHVSLRINNLANRHYTTVYGYNNAGNNWLLSLRYSPR